MLYSREEVDRTPTAAAERDEGGGREVSGRVRARCWPEDAWTAIGHPDGYDDAEGTLSL